VRSISENLIEQSTWNEPKINGIGVAYEDERTGRRFWVHLDGRTSWYEFEFARLLRVFFLIDFMSRFVRALDAHVRACLVMSCLERERERRFRRRRRRRGFSSNRRRTNE
jgi:hypothetical protein